MPERHAAPAAYLSPMISSSPSAPHTEPSDEIEIEIQIESLVEGEAELVPQADAAAQLFQQAEAEARPVPETESERAARANFVAPVAPPQRQAQPERRTAPVAYAPRPIDPRPAEPRPAPRQAGPPEPPRPRAEGEEAAIERTATAPQLRRFIKSRAYVPMHELRRRFLINGGDDDVTPVDIERKRIFVGLPEREGRLLGELLRAGDIGYELSLDPISPIVVGVYPMRPVTRA